MAQDEMARVDFEARVEVWIGADDIRAVKDYEKMVSVGAGREELAVAAAQAKIRSAEEAGGLEITVESPTIDSDRINWEAVVHPSEQLWLSEEAAVRDKLTRTAGNPAQQLANDALKIAKELSNLQNKLAGLSNRDEIAQAAGIQELPEAIERLYELADRYRQGQVTEITPAYAGWDLDRLRRQGKPFIDDKKQPIETVVEDAEKHRFEREQTSSPHAVSVELDK